MNDNEIRHLLENIEVQPSARCWEAIESGIAAAGSAAGGTAAAAKTAAHATRHLSAAAVKTLIIGGVATAVVAGTFVAVALFSGGHDASNVSEPIAAVAADTATTSSNETVAADSVAEISVAGASNAISHTKHENDIVEVAARDIVDKSADAAVPPSSLAAEALSPKSIPPAATQQPVHTPVAVPTPAAPLSPSVESSSPSSAPQPVSHAEDPILAGRDDLGFAPPVAIEIPNVITPNGDGYNDLFIIKGIENCEKSKLIVRSKSGGVVLQISDYQNNWDAQNAPDGTYFYQLYYTIHGIEEVRTGTLTIIR